MYIMNLNLNKKTELNKKSNFILYSIEQNDTPYVYFYMIKNVNNLITQPSIYLKNIQESKNFVYTNFSSFKCDYKGTMDYNNENMIVYEIIIDNNSLEPTYFSDSWWKVTPFEILNSQKVLHFKIDQYIIDFFKNNPQFFYLFNNNVRYEVPIVGYLGIDSIELNEQILLGDINYKNDEFGRGYYFETLEEAYFNSLYSNSKSNEYIIKLINHNYINELTPLDKFNITIKDNKFYYNSIFIGDVPENCNTYKYTFFKYNKDYIYLKSSKKMTICGRDYSKRKNEGCILRYVLFLKNCSYHKKSGFNSYFSFKKSPYWFPYYMIKNQNQANIISYHFSENSPKINKNYIEEIDKNTYIRIK